MPQEHHLLLLKKVRKEFWKVASSAALAGTVGGKLGAWNANLDASLHIACFALTLKICSPHSFPHLVQFAFSLVKTHTTGTACIVGRGVTMRPCPWRASLRETCFGACRPSATSLSSPGAAAALPKPPCPSPTSLRRKEMMEPYLVPRLPPSFLGDLHCWQRASWSGIKVTNRHLHRCWVKWGSASLSPRDPLGLHVCRCQSYRRKLTNRSQAEEVLRISPDTKQNKNRRVCLVRKASMYPVWRLEPYLPSTGGGGGGTKYERTRHLEEFL